MRLSLLVFLALVAPVVAEEMTQHQVRLDRTRVSVIKPEPLVERPASISATFSIVAADPESGECGAAVASKFPSVGDVVPHVRAGVGVFCTQHGHNPQWGPMALDLLQQGKQPEEVFAELLRKDSMNGYRQIAIVDMQGRVLNRNPWAVGKPDHYPESRYLGGMTGQYYACQGNTLAGRDVIVAMARAYEETKGSLADRLMAALLAGDRAGGDHRGKLAAAVRVAKRGASGYTTNLSVDKHKDAVEELTHKYAEIRRTTTTEGSSTP
jgi:uncharacterized Ntn-hydrolase superfamily protein